MESGIRRSPIRGISARIGRWRARIRAILNADRYHPEEHYMRGPGPKTQEKLRSRPEARGE